MLFHICGFFLLHKDEVDKVTLVLSAIGDHCGHCPINTMHACIHPSISSLNKHQVPHTVRVI